MITQLLAHARSAGHGLRRPVSSMALGLALLGHSFLSAPAWAAGIPGKPQTANTLAAVPVVTVDVCVYGGISAGVIGAYTTAKMGKKTVLIEPTNYLGGMTSSGLGATDIGNKYAITHLAKDFYRRVGKHYGVLEQWLFEPKVAEGIFEDYAKRGGYQVFKLHRLLSVQKKGNKIVSIELERTDAPGKPALKIVAKQFMDCSYEGDLMAKAGVSYVVGREDNKEFNETLNGVQLQHKHQFPDSIDPYKIPGDPKSGLLWGISDKPVAPNGTGDKKVQAYNYRLCLSTDPANMMPFSQPEGYDPNRYALLGRLIEKGKWKKVENYLLINKIPNNKTDVNHRGGFSLDYIGMNWDYPEADFANRDRIARDHANYIKGLLYYLANDPALPAETKASMKKYGWPKDEFKENGGFPRQLYVREARRMRGMTVMTQAHCQAKEVVNDGIGLAAYQMDSHNCQRIVKDGMVKNEGNVEVDLGSKPYPISYRAILPKPEQVTNLTVPVCLSATHIAYGSIRMEPVFMVLAQSAGVAAVKAINQNQDLHQIDVVSLNRDIARNPMADGSTPEILLDNDNAEQVKQTSGTWKRVEDLREKFGPSAFIRDTLDSSPAKITWEAESGRAATYDIYFYVTNMSVNKTLPTFSKDAKLSWSVDGNALTTKPLTLPKDLSGFGEWVQVGNTTIPAGGKVSFTLEVDGYGTFPADALLLIPRAERQ